jgi:hypothetical protein
MQPVETRPPSLPETEAPVLPDAPSEVPTVDPTESERPSSSTDTASAGTEVRLQCAQGGGCRPQRPPGGCLPVDKLDPRLLCRVRATPCPLLRRASTRPPTRRRVRPQRIVPSSSSSLPSTRHGGEARAGWRFGARHWPGTGTGPALARHAQLSGQTGNGREAQGLGEAHTQLWCRSFSAKPIGRTHAGGGRGCSASAGYPRRRRVVLPVRRRSHRPDQPVCLLESLSVLSEYSSA